MPTPKQRRVRWNLALTALGCGVALGVLHERVLEHFDAALFGTAAGAGTGFLFWRWLRPRIRRTERRFAANRVFVGYLSAVEVLLAAVAYRGIVTLPVVGLAVGAGFVAVRSEHWWTVAVAAAGLVGSAVSAFFVARFERGHGPLWYEYDSRWWSGAEGMRYRTGKVVRPLEPVGTVSIRGELWQARSATGNPIATGETVEVLEVEGLTLTVDDTGPQPRS